MLLSLKLTKQLITTGSFVGGQNIQTN